MATHPNPSLRPALNVLLNLCDLRERFPLAEEVSQGVRVCQRAEAETEGKDRRHRGRRKKNKPTSVEYHSDKKELRINESL